MNVSDAVARKQARALRALARIIESDYDRTGFLGIYRDADGMFVINGKIRSSTLDGAIEKLEELRQKIKRRAA